MAAPRLNPLVLSTRDEAILTDLARVRLLTGSQLERLHFAGVRTINARQSIRRRSLGRLQTARLIGTLPRRVGGARAGSAGLVYYLDSTAQRWLVARAGADDARHRIRRPWPIGWPFVAHTLDVAELYVRLRERARSGELTLLHFAAEPASWYTSAAGLLKPDAFTIWAADGWERHQWLEVDRATESLPTLRRKLLGYLDLANSDDQGPRGVLPEVVVTVPNDRRLRLAHTVVDQLPEPADRMVTLRLFADMYTRDDVTNAARPPP